MKANFFIPQDDAVKIGEQRDIETRDGRTFKVEVEAIDTRGKTKQVVGTVVGVTYRGVSYERKPKKCNLPEMSV